MRYHHHVNTRTYVHSFTQSNTVRRIATVHHPLKAPIFVLSSSSSSCSRIHAHAHSQNQTVLAKLPFSTEDGTTFGILWEAGIVLLSPTSIGLCPNKDDAFRLPVRPVPSNIPDVTLIERLESGRPLLLRESSTLPKECQLVCVFVCAYVCIYMQIHGYLYVCVCVYIYIYICTHLWIFVCVCTYGYGGGSNCECVFVACLHTLRVSYLYLYVCSMHQYTCFYGCMYMHIHTHINFIHKCWDASQLTALTYAPAQPGLQHTCKYTYMHTYMVASIHTWYDLRELTLSIYTCIHTW